MVEIHKGPFKVHKSDGKPVPLELHPRIFKYSNFTAWVLWCLYVFYQLNFAWLVQNHTSNLLWRMWVALFAELCLSFQEAVLAFNTVFALFCAQGLYRRPCYRLVGDSAPTVDVFVLSCREPVDVVLNNVAAAAAQDYPPHRFRVMLLDDGRDERLREGVKKLDMESKDHNGPRILYLSRLVKPGVRSYFKAGNLRFGIEESVRLGGSDFLAALDADMIPRPDWLRRMVPHLLLDDELALACPPQQYYNVPEDDPLGQKAEFDLWFTIYEPLNDCLDAAMCTGSGWVVKRSAITDIGGWPLVEAGEDFMCSTVLSNAGWKVAFIREDLQCGLAPGSLRGHVKQRMRWVDSGIEVHKQFGFYLPAAKMTSKMTWAQRGVAILMALREYAPITNIIALILLPIAVFPTQSDELSTIVFEKDRFRLRTLFLAAFMARKVNNYIVYRHVGIRGLNNFQSNDIWCAPYAASRCLLSLLPRAAHLLTFEPSGTIISSADERSRVRRKPLPYRLLSPDLLLYSLYVVYASVPLLLRLLAHGPWPFNMSPLSGPGFPFPGPIVKLVDSIAKMAVPLVYMTFPPTVPEWEELVQRDEAGIERPRERKAVVGGDCGRVPWYWSLSWKEVGELLTVWYCIHH